MQENKYKEYSEEKVKTYKEKWDKDFFCGVSLMDIGEAFFIFTGIFIFLCLSWKFQISFIVVLILFYWFRIKWEERKIVKAKKFLVLGGKFLNESFKGRGVTKEGAKPHYRSHSGGF